MLTLAEEVLLLAVDDENGSFVSLPQHSLEFALTGAVLMDLALHRRIDTDLEQLMVIDATPLDDDILDPVLDVIGRAGKRYNAKRWVTVLAQDAGQIRERALDRLIERGILRKDEQKVLWVFGKRRYPVIDDAEQKEVKLRILDLISGDEIPDQRDIVVIALADACGLFASILAPKQLDAAGARIAQIVRMDLIAQAMSKALRDMRDLGRWVGSPREEIVWPERG